MADGAAAAGICVFRRESQRTAVPHLSPYRIEHSSFLPMIEGTNPSAGGRVTEGTSHQL